MPRFSAKARKLRGGGKTGRPFIQLYHFVKRSTAYHSLSPTARALLLELIDRYTGINNGMIVLGVREAEHELHSSHATICRAMRELDDAGIARPTRIGAWRGRRATEWRLMWKRCDQTGDLPKTQWDQRPRYVPSRPGRKRAPPPDEFEVRYESAKGPLRKRNGNSRSATKAQNENSSIDHPNSRPATKAHVHMYQTHGRGDDERE